MSHLAFCSFSMVSLSFDAGTATDRAFLLGGLILKDHIWVPLNPRISRSHDFIRQDLGTASTVWLPGSAHNLAPWQSTAGTLSDSMTCQRAWQDFAFTAC